MQQLTALFEQQQLPALFEQQQLTALFEQQQLTALFEQQQLTGQDDGQHHLSASGCHPPAPTAMLCRPPPP